MQYLILFLSSLLLTGPEFKEISITQYDTTTRTPNFDLQQILPNPHIKNMSGTAAIMGAAVTWTIEDYCKLASYYVVDWGDDFIKTTASSYIIAGLEACKAEYSVTVTAYGYDKKLLTTGVADSKAKNKIGGYS